MLMTKASKIEKQGRILFPDVIRAYAIILVILLHVTASLMESYLSMKATWWWTGNVLFSFAHQSVPLFVMISGMLLLNPDKNETISVFFQKRIKKVLFPFLFWGMVYLFWGWYFHGKSLTVVSALTSLVKGPIYFHFWFIYMILGLYLWTPILRIISKSASVNQLIYFVALWFFAVSIRPILGYIGIDIGIQMTVVSGFVGYFIIGHLMEHINLKKKYSKYFFALIVIMMLFTSIGTYVLTLRHNGQYRATFVDMLMPNIVVMSVCVYYLLKTVRYERLFNKVPIFSPMVKFLSNTSFGIYLTHVIIMEVLGSGKLGFSLTASSIHPFIGIPATALITVVLCSIIIYSLRRIPYVKYIVT
jgi:surface polysaccharide O-acyltransferase-like enzyme